jgi:hypothetical protein
MQTGSEESAGRKPRDYRITVREEVGQMFVDALECVVVESTGRESSLYCAAADQAKLQAVLGWLYSRGIEILKVVPADDGADPVDPASSGFIRENVSSANSAGHEIKGDGA